jgi:hypothetical protein
MYVYGFDTKESAGGFQGNKLQIFKVKVIPFSRERQKQLPRTDDSRGKQSRSKKTFEPNVTETHRK